MGPIAYPQASDGTVSNVNISVQFDRPVTASTFTTADVQVYYHDTTNGDPLTPLTVISVTPVTSSGNAQDGYTEFTATFNPTPARRADTLQLYRHLQLLDSARQ